MFYSILVIAVTFYIILGVIKVTFLVINNDKFKNPPHPFPRIYAASDRRTSRDIGGIFQTILALPFILLVTVGPLYLICNAVVHPVSAYNTVSGAFDNLQNEGNNKERDKQIIINATSKGLDWLSVVHDCGDYNSNRTENYKKYVGRTVQWTGECRFEESDNSLRLHMNPTQGYSESSDVVCWMAKEITDPWKGYFQDNPFLLEMKKVPEGSLVTVVGTISEKPSGYGGYIFLRINNFWY